MKLVLLQGYRTYIYSDSRTWKIIDDENLYHSKKNVELSDCFDLTKSDLHAKLYVFWKMIRKGVSVYQ